MDRLNWFSLLECGQKWFRSLKLAIVVLHWCGGVVENSYVVSMLSVTI
jgi:hypothetical protein